MRRDRFLWAGQWTVALAFYFIAMIKLGLENRLRAAEAVEIALALLAIVPARTEILPQVSTLALALLPVAALVLPAHGTGLAPVDATLAVLAAIVALARLKLGYAIPSASSNSPADGLSSGAIARQRSPSPNSASLAAPRTHGANGTIGGIDRASTASSTGGTENGSSFETSS
jgi:hypothetical protein